MVRQIRLLIAASVACAITFTLIAGSVAEAADKNFSGDCTAELKKLSICNDDKQVAVHEQRQQTTHGTKSVPPGAENAANLQPVDPQTEIPSDVAARVDTIPACSVVRRDPVCTAPLAAATPATPANTVTLEDVARFLPAQGVVHAEPNGWAVVGLPDNFWVDATTGVVDGRLFGGDAKVRFTPRAYVWNYGDGDTRTSATPGASWQSLGQKQLTQTATSHEYAERGRHTVTVQVVYSAEYEVGGGPWLPVAGTVRATTPGTSILAAIESTVLTPNG